MRCQIRDGFGLGTGCQIGSGSGMMIDERHNSDEKDYDKKKYSNYTWPASLSGQGLFLLEEGQGLGLLIIYTESRAQK